MPSTIKYLNVVFVQDKLIGNTVYPTDWETSLPDDLARSLAPKYVTITGPGTYAEMVAPDGSTAENGATVTVLTTDSRLELPHPRLHERAFVLAPLAELAPAAA